MSKKSTMKKMRILRTVEAFYPFVGGVANQAYNISKGLEEKGISSPVLTTYYRAKGTPNKEKMEGVRVRRFPINWRIMKYFYTPEMKNYLSGFNLIHAHNFRSYQTEIAFKAAKKQKKPFVISVHGSLLGYDNFLKGVAKLPYIFYDLLRGKKIIKNADAIIVNSKDEYKEAIKYGVEKKKLHLIPVGIHVEQYKPLKKEKSKELKILFVGRISRNRNVEPIIKAAAILKKKLPCKFIIVGGEEKSSETSKTGYVRELKDLAKKLKVTDIVKFTGPKYREELKKIYRTSDIFVYTSLSENFGQTILEAGAAGLPIICTKVGIAPEIIKDGKNGFLVKDDERMIAARILKLTDKKKRDKWGKATRLIIKKKFGWEEIIEKYIRIYNSLIDKD